MADTRDSYEERIKLLEQELVAERAEKSRLASLYSPQSTTIDPGSIRPTPPRPLPMETYLDIHDLKDNQERHLPHQPPLITMKVEPAKPEFYYGDDTVNTDIRKVKNINIWLKQIHRYVGSLPADQQLRVASGFLRGPAE